jgi:hypothetical protein
MDVRVEVSLFVARPLLPCEFQSSNKQLQAIGEKRTCDHLSMSSHKGTRLAPILKLKQRQRILTCSRLFATLAGG